MYDPQTSRYAFACPTRGETHVLLSAFRSIEQLPGASHPAVFRVRFDCDCIKRGEWPWSFFCYPEERPRPVFPSSFTLLTATDGTVGLAVRCPSCRRLSLNLVSHPHVDVPFHNDRQIGVVEHLFADDALATLEAFRTELWSATFDARRLALE